MDLNAKAIGFAGGVWTDELHASFLNRMEETFVRTMLGPIAGRRRPRLDRMLPDSDTESTNGNRGVGRGSAAEGSGESTMDICDSRRNQLSPCSVAEDQVVPQL